ncbi:Myosin 10A, isoform D [Irineochytrium annulatum]|nr:Myosin 10A, isoform D [Irineochytrium annulatum]
MSGVDDEDVGVRLKMRQRFNQQSLEPSQAELEQRRRLQRRISYESTGENEDGFGGEDHQEEVNGGVEKAAHEPSTALITNVIMYARALYDFPAKDPQELNIEEQDIVSVPITMPDQFPAQNGWLYGECNGNWGWFPEGYVRFLTEDELVAEELVADPAGGGGSVSGGNEDDGGASETFEEGESNVDNCSIEQFLADSSAGTLSTEQPPTEDEENLAQLKRRVSQRDDNHTSAPVNHSDSESNASTAVNLPHHRPNFPDAAFANNRTTSIDMERPVPPPRKAGGTPVSPSASRATTPTSTAPAPPSGSERVGWFSKYRQKGKKAKDGLAELNTSSASAVSSESAQSIGDVEAALPAPKSKGGSGVGTPTLKARPLIGIKKLGAAAAAKMVSIIGVPAGPRQTWSDKMGGEAVVEALKISKQERRRQEIIYELISTEQDFVDDLYTVIEVYIKQLKKTKLLRPKDMSVIFSNIEALLPVNEELLKSLTDRQNQSANGVVEQIGDIFIRVSDYLKMYTMYCSNHPYAMMKLQSVRQTKAVAKFLDHCAAAPESRNLGLLHFLLKPVQRICKYPLLLREILKATDNDHPDAENLRGALSKIETVVTIVNEGARQAEAVHRMVELQARLTLQRVQLVTPSRTLHRSGTVDWIAPAGEKKRRELYLFNDVVLLTKLTEDDNGAHQVPLDTYVSAAKLKLVAMVPIDMFLANSPPQGPLPPQADPERLMEIVYVNTSRFTLECPSREGREAWMASFGEVIEAWMAVKGRGAGVEGAEGALRNRIVEGRVSVSQRDLQREEAERSQASAENLVGAREETERPADANGTACAEGQNLRASAGKERREEDEREALPARPTKAENIITASPSASPPQTESPPPSSPPLSTHPLPSLARREATKSPGRGSTVRSMSLITPASVSGSTHSILGSAASMNLSAAVLASSQSSISSRIASNRFIVQDQVSHTNSSASVHSLSAGDTATHQRSATAQSAPSRNQLRSYHPVRLTAPLGSNPALSYSLPSLAQQNQQHIPVNRDPAAGPSSGSVDIDAGSVHSISVRERVLKLSGSGLLHSAARGGVGGSVSSVASASRAGSDPRLRRSIDTLVMLTNSEENSLAGSQSLTASIGKLTEDLGSLMIKRPAFNKPVRKVVMMDVERRAVGGAVASQQGTMKDVFVYSMAVQFVQPSSEARGYCMIKHTFEDFFDLHMQLLAHFPVEAGMPVQETNAPEDSYRIIPELPGQMMFVSEAVAKSRMTQLQEYVQ